MKIIALSDMHGDLPEIDQACDVVCICGDVIPLMIQRNIPQSIKWMREDFRKWCDGIDCEKIIIIAGNHDFVFEYVFNDWTNSQNIDPNIPRWRTVGGDDEKYKNITLADYVADVFGFSEKMVYLHDNSIEIEGKVFYGTPYIPELYGWAFYRNDEELEALFRLIPDSVDVLLTHSPGKFVNDTGVSLEKYDRPEYGSSILTKCVQDKIIGLWLCGHVHSGNHHVEKYGSGLTANVSIKNERYDIAYEPLVIEI